MNCLKTGSGNSGISWCMHILWPEVSGWSGEKSEICLSTTLLVATNQTDYHPKSHPLRGEKVTSILLMTNQERMNEWADKTGKVSPVSRPWSTSWLSLAIQSVATGNQWSRPMKPVLILSSFFFFLPDYFPVAADWIVRLSQKVDGGPKPESLLAQSEPVSALWTWVLKNTKKFGKFCYW